MHADMSQKQPLTQLSSSMADKDELDDRVNGYNTQSLNGGGSAEGRSNNSMPCSKASGYVAGIPESTQPYTKWDADRDEVEVDYKQMGNGDALHRRSSRWFSGRKGVVLKAMLLLVTFLCGLIVGNILRKTLQSPSNNGACYPDRVSGDYNQVLSNSLVKNIDAMSIRYKLKAYSHYPHLTATHQNTVLRDLLLSDFNEYGIQTKTASYNVLLSYHDWGLENQVSLLNENGSTAFSTTYHGPEVGVPNSSSFPTLSEPYCAFSPNGTAEGQLVYANFGEESDFQLLKKNRVSCEGRIVIMRYGRIYRGKMVQNAEKYGAIGVLLYSDPAEVVDNHRPDVFPRSWNLPGWAVQRGSILPELIGDPLSPGFPSKAGMHRIPLEEAAIPKIPVQPLGYDDAHMLMMHMKGFVDNSFLGNMHENVSYSMGPGYLSPRTNWTVKLEVFNELEQRDVTNLFGIIEGRQEPDRYVIIGSHYDAWTYGSVDPNSGTAILMEIAKAFGSLLQTGWKPRRTILFANWDAEEQGLMGSYEWVEDHPQELKDKAVIYINLDSAVKGNATLNVKSSPMFRHLFMNITEEVPPAADDTAESLYDVWTRISPSSKNASQPHIGLMGSGSDQAPFTFTLGIPSFHAQYYFDPRLTSLSQIPAYHTAVDNMLYMAKFVDPSFRAHATLARLIAEMTLQLAAQVKLPMDTRELAGTLEEEFNSLHSTLSAENLPSLPHLGQLMYRVGNFTSASLIFHSAFLQLDASNVLAVRRWNDALQRVSLCFVHSDGLPGRPHIKNVIFSPSALDSYSATSFTGIRDALTAYEQLSPSDQLLSKAWLTVERQISIAILALECATHTLTGSCFV